MRWNERIKGVTMRERKTFLVYKEWKDPVNLLSNEQAGILFKSMFAYWNNGEMPDFDNDPALKMVSSFIIPQFLRDKTAYDRKCAVNKENGSKGGRPKKSAEPKETERFSEKAKKAEEGEEEGEDKDKGEEEGEDKDKGEEEGEDKEAYNGIRDAYNTLCPSLPAVRYLSDARKKAIKARLNSYSEDDLIEAFKKTEASEFLKGQNDRNWQANFDWIMKDSNLAKILDGKYDNRLSGAVKKSKAAEMLDDSYRMMVEWAGEKCT